MIVTCEGCNTRFHLADGQVPPQGARVRCSKCHHRFLVKPSDGQPETRPAKKPAAQTSPISTTPETRPTTDEPDLDNPEFLFDGKESAQSAVFGGQTMPLGDKTRQVDSGGLQRPDMIPDPGGAASPPDPGPEGSAAPLETPESSSEAGPGDDRLGVPGDSRDPDGDQDQEDELFGDAEVPTDKNLGAVGGDAKAEDLRAQESGARELEIGSVADVDFTAGAPTDEEPLVVTSFDGLAQPYTLASSEPPPEPAASELEGSDPESLDPPGVDEPDPTATADEPGPESNPLVGTDLDAEDLLSGVLDEEDDGDSAGLWDPLGGPDRPDPSPPLSVEAPPAAASIGTRGSDAVATPRLEVPTPSREKETDLMAGRLADRLLGIAAVAVGLLLVVAGIRAMATHGLGHEPGPETVRGAGWVATDIEALQLRDASERPVLVLRGLLLPQGGGPPPIITARLLDDRGVSIGPAYPGVLVRLGNPELSPQALSEALAPDAVLVQRGASRADGFTVLIPNPAPEAQRFEINLGS